MDKIVSLAECVEQSVAIKIAQMTILFPFYGMMAYPLGKLIRTFMQTLVYNFRVPYFRPKQPHKNIIKAGFFCNYRLVLLMEIYSKVMEACVL